MTVIDTNIQQFSDEKVRADSAVILGLYHNATDLITRRNAHGDIATTIANEEDWIRDTAQQMMQVFNLCLDMDNQWFNRFDDGGSTTLANSVPDTTEVIGEADNRPAVTGQDLHRIVGQESDIVKWFGDAAWGGDGTGGQTDAVKNSIILCAALSGNIPLNVGQVTTFIDTRCVSFRDEYDVTNGLKLSHVNRTAVNARRFQ